MQESRSSLRWMYFNSCESISQRKYDAQFYMTYKLIEHPAARERRLAQTQPVKIRFVDLKTTELTTNVGPYHVRPRFKCSHDAGIGERVGMVGVLGRCEEEGERDCETRGEIVRKDVNTALP